LNVMAIRIPALRERITDLPDLTEFLLDTIGRQQNRKLKITDGAIRQLMNHDWPGNVRELENTLERAAIMSEDGNIDREVISLTGLDSAPAAKSSMVASMAAPMAMTRMDASGVDANSGVANAGVLNNGALNFNELGERERV